MKYRVPRIDPAIKSTTTLGRSFMKPITRAVILMGAIALGAPAFATFPEDNVTSDAFGNTGMGTSALSAEVGSSTSSANTAAGYQALLSNTTGNANTAVGYDALQNGTNGNSNTAVGVLAAEAGGGAYNTAVGASALEDNTSNSDDVAIGASAMMGSQASNSTAVGEEALFYASGVGGTAVGFKALYNAGSATGNTAVGFEAGIEVDTAINNTLVGYETMSWSAPGSNNSSLGAYALQYNAGAANTAVGADALQGKEGETITGSDNTAIGYQTMLALTTGTYNAATGYQALYDDTTGAQNAGFGSFALLLNTRGNYNTAVGTDSLRHNSTGSTNIALGYEAGYAITTTSNNIDIGSQGAVSDGGVIRIGSSNQTSTYVAGISGVAVTGTGVPVVVNSSGQLGIGTSSERFKTAVTPMGSSTEKLEELRPVTFQYKSDPHGSRQYGLIAEEVAKVYPELVVHDAQGAILSVRYDELAPMLLNVVQHQAAEIEKLKARARAQALDERALRQQQQAVGDLQTQLADMRTTLSKLGAR
jgi:trimeric autotransporter adhesin